jgi:hypothetical protein
LGAGITVATVFMIMACTYQRIQDHRIAKQDRKYANWTDREGVWEEFSQTEVKPTSRNPLHIAICVKNLPLVKKLVGDGYQRCDFINRNGLYALHFASASHSMEILKYIAEHTPYNFRPEGHSPLHVAAGEEDFDALGYLIETFPELQKNRDSFRANYLEVLCVDTIGSDYLRRCLNTDPKYGRFIEAHRKHIPKELFQGLLTPYRDFSQDQVAIEMDAVDSETKGLLQV